MSTRTNTKPDGFTVIEVLIVLAIAALILLIVFLAVPALQRNSRNLRRERDASMIASARQDADLNIPHTTGFASVSYSACLPPITRPSICGTIQDDGLTYYDLSNVTVYYNPFNSPPTSAPPTPDLDHIDTATFLICNSTNTDATPVNASALDMVVLYSIESSSGPVERCLQSRVYTTN